ncbi:MAG: LysR family transcriptional regulator [Candidatus Nucleicultricaceae bacterium]
MNFDDMEIFVTIKECGSFSEAARILNLPRSTVSVRMTKLEETLGAKLIHRSNKSLHITPIGELFFEKCLEILAKIHEVETVVQNSSDSFKGRLRVFLPHEFAVVFLQDAIKSFLERFPSIHLELNLTTRNIDLIQEGYDIALRLGHLKDSSLISLKLGQVELALYANPQLLASLPPIKNLTDLPLDKCLPFKTSHVLEWEFLQLTGEIQKILPAGRLQVNSMIMLCAAAAAGQGIAALNVEMAKAYEKDGRLVRLLPEISMVPTEIYALYPTRKLLLPSVRVFLDFMKDEIRKGLIGKES